MGSFLFIFPVFVIVFVFVVGFQLGRTYSCWCLIDSGWNWQRFFNWDEWARINADDSHDRRPWADSIRVIKYHQLWIDAQNSPTTTDDLFDDIPF